MVQSKKTLVLGASMNPERYAYLAIRKLKYNQIPVVAVGLREGEVCGVHIEKPFPKFENIHTVTMYIGPKNQAPYLDYIIGLNPSRVIFNPGTENEPFEERLREHGIEVVRACTLIMISNELY
jgi:predicted CoA-binding protein